MERELNVLIVVDLQNDFCPGGALAVSEGDVIVPVINQMLESAQFDLKILSADKHKPEQVSFAVNHGQEPFTEIIHEGIKQKVWPVHCVEGTWGAEFHPELKVGLADHIIIKGDDPSYDSLSAFFDLSRTRQTKLASILDHQASQRGLARSDISLTICGLALDYCVAQTAIDAARLGFKVEIALEASRAVNNSLEAEISLLRELIEAGVTIAQSQPHVVERTLSKNVNLSV